MTCTGQVTALKLTFHIIKAPIANGLNTVRKQYTEARSKLVKTAQNAIHQRAAHFCKG